MPEINKSQYPVEKAHVTSTEPLDAKDAKWIRLTRVNYKDPSGRARVWESAERQTRQDTAEVDGVGIVAILYDSSKPKQDQTPHILLQKQFRPPANAVVIEVPAGLLDPNESVETCALRELYEETGYSGVVLTSSFLDRFARGPPAQTATPTEDNGLFGTSMIMYNDPGFCTTNLRMVHVGVDLCLPENKDPKPQLEDGEFIECFSVPLRDLWKECRRLEGEGYAVDARVATIGEGIELACGFGL